MPRLALRCGIAVAVLLLAFVAGGCGMDRLATAGATTDSEAAAGPLPPDDPRLHELIVRLDENARYLKELYRDLRKIAEHVMWGNDALLNTVQKSALYVQQAEVICRGEVELLSVVTYIRKDRLHDYYSLQRKTLARAAADSQTTMQLMHIYGTFVEEPTAAATVVEAQRVIEANIDLFQQVAERITF